MSSAGKRLINSARQALAFAKGEVATQEYRVRIPAEIDVRAIRKKMGMTQEKFAAVFGVSAAVIRDWEQGRRMPSTSARVLLKVIAHEPEAVQRALAA
ncbi:MAG: helix-turn-helix domain-containing protein [Rhodospirillales bacterium]|jgi:putative transcriptional regulator|nr:helix-turn-helix domain-containing protein [Rhodospirillales bacterium]